MTWQANPIMEWSFDDGVTWELVTDHGRSPLNIDVERIESVQTMANGRKRRYVVAKKRNFSTSWENLPDKATTFLTNGQPGSRIEQVHDTVDGSFHMRLRAGSDRDTVITGLDGVVLEVMITDFSKEIVKRGQDFDLWSLDITLAEV